MDNKTHITWANSLANVIGIIGGLSLTCSLIYDWGFYYAANLKFHQIPITLSDHLRGSLNWLPKAALAVGIIFVIELFLKRAEKGMSEEEIIQSSKKPEKIRKLRESPKYIIAFITLLSLAVYLMFGELFAQDIGFPIIILWFLFEGLLRLNLNKPLQLIPRCSPNNCLLLKNKEGACIARPF